MEEQQEPAAAPLIFFYTRLHDAIRAELGTLSHCVARLEGPAAEQGIEAQLAHLSSRYRFLEQVYKYHSSVEDEVREG
jgi:zinc finger-like protein